MSTKRKTRTRCAAGMTLIEAAIAVAILITAFVGLYGLFKASARQVTTSRIREGALSLATQRMEQLHALPYASIGTTSGTPSGAIVAHEQTVQSGFSYTRDTTISYVDDSADGLGASDTDDNTQDYKRAEVSILYQTASGTSTVTLVSDFSTASEEDSD